jgi:hypothetical protein
MEPPARVGMQLLADLVAQSTTQQQLSATTRAPAGRLCSKAPKRALLDDERGIATAHETAAMETTTASEASGEDLRERAAQVHASKKAKRKPSHVLRRVRLLHNGALDDLSVGVAHSNEMFLCLFVQEAKKQLLAEVRELEQRSRQLREQAGLPDNSDVLAREEENMAMQKALHKQKLAIANAQSMFSQYTVGYPSCLFVRSRRRCKILIFALFVIIELPDVEPY